MLSFISRLFRREPIEIRYCEDCVFFDGRDTCQRRFANSDSLIFREMPKGWGIHAAAERTYSSVLKNCGPRGRYFKAKAVADV